MINLSNEILPNRIQVKNENIKEIITQHIIVISLRVNIKRDIIMSELQICWFVKSVDSNDYSAGYVDMRRK